MRPISISPIIIVLTEATSLSLTAQKIMGFSSLENGWHFGDGVAPTMQRILAAIEIVNEAIANGYITDAVPGISGEIQVICYKGSSRLEFTLEENETVTFISEQDGVEVRYEENVEQPTAVSYLSNEGEPCDWSILSTEAITCASRNDFQTWHSLIPPEAAAYRSFQVTASNE